VTPADPNLRFGPDGRFELQPLERRLLVDGLPAVLGARAFDLLLELASRPGALRSKNDLIEAVWPGVIVEDGNLATQISTLRKILGGEVIATIPGRGYRFAARMASTSAVAAAPEPPPSAAPAAPAAAAPPAARLQTNLPAALPLLVGRSEDLAALDELVAQRPLVSIIGAGGIGKTTVALHLTALRQSAYRHGVCWVELASLVKADDLPGAIAAALGVQVGSGEPLAGLCAALMPLSLLLVLDNAEQVVDGVARLVQTVLDKAPGVRFVVTTQVPLKLASERVYRIGPLTVPPGPLPAAQALGFSAVALFAERAQLADVRFALTDANSAAVIAVCRQLDGLALAIELAAARAPMLGVHKLAASMGDRLRLLTATRNRIAPARQQTLRAALEWSHAFLDETERKVFRRLAVFAGSVSLAMIQQVVRDPEGELDEWTVLDALALLVDRSLVVTITADGADESRYRLLETPRAYALERLKEAGEEEALRQRHMNAMAAFCETAWHAYYGGQIGKQDWHQTYALEADNAAEALACAIARGDRVAALRILATQLQTFWTLPTARRIELAEQCAARIDDTVPMPLQVRAWGQVALALTQIRPHQAHEAARRALDLVQRSAELREDSFVCYWALCRGIGSAERGSRGGPEVQAALAQARALEDPGWPAHRRVLRARAEASVANVVSAGSPASLGWWRELLALELASGNTGFAPRSNLIAAELAAGDAQAAALAGESLLAELQGGREEAPLAHARINVAAAWLVLDRLPRVRELARAGWQHGRLFELQPYWATYCAALAALESRPRAAARLAGYADARYATRGEPRETNEAAAHARACALADAALGRAEFERLQDEGRLLGDDQIEAIAFATDDGA